MNQIKIETQLVDGKTLLNTLFAKNCRPSVRWLRDQKKAGRIKSVKIGRLVFFDPAQVKADLFPNQQPEQTRVAA